MAAAPTNRPRRRGATAALALLLAVAMLVSACSSSEGGAASTTAKPPTERPSTSTTTTPPAELTEDRPYEVHVPPGYEQGTPAPLLVLLHGYGTTGEIQNAYLGLTEAADERGMLLVHPDGTKNRIGKQFWNATDACCGGPNPTVDDSAYLTAVIAEISDAYDVDPARVFIVGHSNGGFMAYRMACDHADVIAGIVSLEGATFEDPDDCSPSEPVATLEVHGTADTTIRYDGGDIVGKDYPSAEETATTWATYNGCSTTPADAEPATRPVVEGLDDATVTSYATGCDAGGHTELWTQPDGVHIPRWHPTFKAQILDYLLAHPKP